MEKDLERYYTDFDPPPVAPTFYPTEEDFADPILYVAKIKSEAEKYGLIKIIPPKSFRPPFCIDPVKFEFTPRVQRLNEIDALFRLRIIFINKLVKFWQIHGQHFRIPWAENKYIDLYRLQKLVAENGGLRKVTETRRWSHIAKCLGFKPTAGPSLKYHYTKWIHPFELHLDSVDGNGMSNGPSTSEEAKDDSKNVPQTRQQSRMMAGLEKRKIKPIPSLDISSLQDKSDHRTPIELVICAKCGHGDDEARLLLCETCDNSLHIYCANPPLMEVPKGEWRCHTCVTNAVKSVSTDFGFVDSQQLFNLKTFTEWANNFKQQYFKQKPTDVPREKVEAEFWRNVVDIDSVVQVKYGADLISSKVGSGFPRREDSINGLNIKEKQYYVNHPWNLNNLPKLKESVLCHMHTDISGMMVPWVYVGMCFSTFCWHVEDHWTYSINYNHWGERKIWYGIPGDEAEHFDQVMRESVPELFADQNDLLHHMTTALNPRFLIDKGVPVYSCHQNAGEFVVTFPRAYHAGYNEGLNFAEAVNFAPPDWLRMGRQCLENYASVQRNCVFSHEELLMKMVVYSNKMSISMCLATIEELSWIVSKETEFRKKLSGAGLRDSQFCKFEDLSDDDRACAVCRTTLFCSGLVCKHEGRIVCSQHVDQLCNICSIRDSCLKFRYTLEDLVPMVKRLSGRTNSFFEWKKTMLQFNSMIEEALNLKQNKLFEQQKLDVNKIRTLSDKWRTSRFPHCAEILRINKLLFDFDKITTNLSKILCRKIRLRDQTICQKVDTRCEYSEVLALREQLEKSIFEDEELEKGLKEICAKVDNWKLRTQKCLEEEYCGINSINILCSLINEAEDEFNIRLESEGLNEMKLVLERYQWLVKAEKIIQQINYLTINETIKNEDEQKEELNKINNNKEEKEEKNDEIIERLNLQTIGKLVIESSRWLSTCQLVSNLTKKLEEKFDIGTCCESLASEFLENFCNSVGFVKAENFWNEKLAIGEWLESESMQTFRDELEIARQINNEFTSINHGLLNLTKLEQLNQKCKNSIFERNGQIHLKIVQMFNSLTEFVEKIKKKFLNDFNYYNLFDIIAGRSDLPALVEGELLPLSLFESNKYTENCIQQHLNFITKEGLTTHLNAINDQRLTLLQALRFANNSKRLLKETCICAKNCCFDSPSKIKKSGDELQNETINCFVCNARFHAICVNWNPFFDLFPIGIYLCQRCLRSKRPSIEQIEATLIIENLPDNSIEKLLVQNLINHSIKIFSNLHNQLHFIPKGIDLNTIEIDTKNKLFDCLIMAFSTEVADPQIYQMLCASAFFDIFPIEQNNIFVLKKIKERKINSTPPRLILFSSIQSHDHQQQSTSSSTSSSVNRRISVNKNKNLLTKGGNRKIIGGKLRGRGGGKKCEELQNSKEENEEEGEDEGHINSELLNKKLINNDDHHMEKCAADICLNPYSEYTRWIQCEAGCTRWYHFCCVGISVRGAQLISSYCCNKCSSSSSSTTSFSVTNTEEAQEVKQSTNLVMEQ